MTPAPSGPAAPTLEDPVPATRLGGDLPFAAPEEAAALVPATATLLVSGFGGVGYPKLVPEAIAAADEERELTVVSGGGVGDEIDRDLVESGDMARRYPFVPNETSRGAANDGRLAFHDRHISRLADEVRFGGLRAGMRGETIAVVEAVAVGPDWLVPSTSIGHTPAYVGAADRLIVEVNRAQPLNLARVHDVHVRDDPPNRSPIPLDDPLGETGGPAVRFDPEKLAAVVETDRPDDPYEFREVSATDEAIAANLGEFLEAELDRNPLLADAVNLQFGVGSLGNALMGALADVDFGDREVAYVGEVVQDGLLDMLDAGDLRGASATSLALSSEGQERLFADVERYAEDVVLRPADVSNAPELIDRFGVVGVNSAVEVDLYGNVNATHIGGTRVVNGIGGGGDFARNCRLGVVALPSTAVGGDVSRVVPLTPHVDHSEHDASVVVTEHGVADLRGRSPRERAEELIAVADPSFREDLEAYRARADDGGGNTPHHLPSAFSWNSTDT
ncbi:acetyl-CoA hydrolase/transferase C-terminal domain-containing protein [Halorubrum distributum]|uniref:Succinate CoA transferase n=1 Tax=Halorubrum distributum JCM 13916 TaxID=1230455 RepID=M0PM85_9EURY|nr:acetyl-CoA hydrolase/transferase C-terminal domain-containing protein [Halorubrum arcis]EMA71186.1 succinate CoA transferase [Halorubrum arcis JCM 13916]